MGTHRRLDDVSGPAVVSAAVRPRAAGRIPAQPRPARAARRDPHLPARHDPGAAGRVGRGGGRRPPGPAAGRTVGGPTCPPSRRICGRGWRRTCPGRVGATSWRRCWPTRGGWFTSWSGSGRRGWSRTCGCPSGRRRGRWRSWCGRTRTCSARSTRPGRWRRRSPPGCPTTPASTSCASRSSPPSTGPHLRGLGPLPDLPHDALLRVLTGHTSAGGGVGGGPGRLLAGLRRRRRARCGSGTRTPGRPATPSPATPARWRRWRSPRTAPGWPPPATTRHGADLGPAHRADPPHPHRPHRRGGGVGGRPGRHLAGLRRRRRARCGSGTRTPGRPATPCSSGLRGPGQLAASMQSLVPLASTAGSTTTTR